MSAPGDENRCCERCAPNGGGVALTNEAWLLLLVAMLYALMLGLLYVHQGRCATPLGSAPFAPTGLGSSGHTGAFVALLVSAHLRKIVAQRCRT